MELVDLMISTGQNSTVGDKKVKDLEPMVRVQKLLVTGQQCSWASYLGQTATAAQRSVIRPATSQQHIITSIHSSAGRWLSPAGVATARRQRFSTFIYSSKYAAAQLPHLANTNHSGFELFGHSRATDIDGVGVIHHVCVCEQVAVCHIQHECRTACRTLRPLLPRQRIHWIHLVDENLFGGEWGRELPPLSHNPKRRHGRNLRPN